MVHIKSIFVVDIINNGTRRRKKKYRRSDTRANENYFKAFHFIHSTGLHFSRHVITELVVFLLYPFVASPSTRVLPFGAVASCNIPKKIYPFWCALNIYLFFSVGLSSSSPNNKREHAKNTAAFDDSTFFLFFVLIYRVTSTRRGWSLAVVEESRVKLSNRTMHY